MNEVPSTGLFSLSLLLQVDKKWFDYQLKVITATSNNLLMVFEIIFSISLRLTVPINRFWYGLVHFSLPANQKSTGRGVKVILDIFNKSSEHNILQKTTPAKNSGGVAYRSRYQVYTLLFLQ